MAGGAGLLPVAVRALEPEVGRVGAMEEADGLAYRGRVLNTTRSGTTAFGKVFFALEYLDSPPQPFLMTEAHAVSGFQPSGNRGKGDGARRSGPVDRSCAPGRRNGIPCKRYPPGLVEMMAAVAALAHLGHLRVLLVVEAHGAVLVLIPRKGWSRAISIEGSLSERALGGGQGGACPGRPVVGMAGAAIRGSGRPARPTAGPLRGGGQEGSGRHREESGQGSHPRMEYLARGAAPRSGRLITGKIIIGRAMRRTRMEAGPRSPRSRPRTGIRAEG